MFPKLYHTFILNDIIRLVEKGNEVFVLSINNTHQKVINKDAFKLKDKTFYLDDFMVENNRYFQKFFMKVKLKLMRYHLFYWFIETFLFGNEIKVRYFKDFGFNISKMIINLSEKKRIGTSKVGEEFVSYISRYGIRFDRLD